jgi:hypothetical protein
VAVVIRQGLSELALGHVHLSFPNERAYSRIVHERPVLLREFPAARHGLEELPLQVLNASAAGAPSPALAGKYASR